jgi:hypothetical protein
VRQTLYDYTIAINDDVWPNSFGAIWRPRFNPVDNSVTAPVKGPGGWTLAKDGEISGTKRYVQLWHHFYSSDGKKIAAIVAPNSGNGQLPKMIPWDLTFNEVVMDPVYSPDNRHLACTGKTDGKWYIAVDGKAWPASFHRAWPPVFSPQGDLVAAKVEINGKYMIAVNGRPLDIFLPKHGTRFSVRTAKNFLSRGSAQGWTRENTVAIYLKQINYRENEKRSSCMIFTHLPAGLLPGAPLLFFSAESHIGHCHNTLEARKKDQAVFNYFSPYYAMRSLMHWIVPFGSRSMRLQPVLTIVAFAFHICLIIVPVFLLAHIILFKESFNISWWYISGGTAQVLTLIVIASCVYFLIRRLVKPDVDI